MTTLTLLKEGKESDAIAIVFNDTVYKSEGPSDELRLTAHHADDLEQVSHELLAIVEVCLAIEPGSLLLRVHTKELCQKASGAIWDMSLFLQVLDAAIVDRVSHDLSAGFGLCTLVGEYACIHQHLVGDLFSVWRASHLFNHSFVFCF